MAEDQKIVIDARINRKAAQADLRGLKADVAATAKEIASLDKQISSASNKQLKISESLKTAQQAATETSKAILELQGKMDLSKQYEALQSENEALTSTLNLQDQKVERLSKDYKQFLEARDKVGDNFTPEQAAASEKANAEYKAQIAEAKAAAEATAAQLDSVSAQMDALRSQGASPSSEADAKKLDSLNAQLAKQQKQVESMKADYEQQSQIVSGLQSKHEALNATLQQEQAAVERQSAALAKAPQSGGSLSKEVTTTTARLTGASKAVNHFCRRLKGIVTGALIFNLISKALRTMVNTMGTALTKVSSFRTAFAQLKGSVYTAAAGLADAVAPALTWILNLISSLINAFIRLISLITGKGIGAMKAQGKAIANAGKSASSAANQLAKFDDLDVLDRGGGGSIAPDFSGIDESTVKLSDTLKDLLDKFKEGFKKGFGDAGEGLKNIKDDLAKIGVLLKEIWTDPEVSAAIKRWTESVAYSLGELAGSVSSIGVSIAEELVGGMERYLERSKEFLKSILSNVFNLGADLSYLFGDFAASAATIFRSLGSEGAKQIASGFIGTFVNAALGMIQTVEQVAYAITKPLFQPIIDNAGQIRETLSSLFAAMSPFFVGISDGVANFYTTLDALFDDVLQPMIDALAEFNSDVLSGLLDKINEFIDGIGGNADKLHDIGEKVGEFIGAFTAAVAVIKTVSTVSSVLTGVFNGIKDAAGLVSAAVGFFTSPFGLAALALAGLVAAGVLLYENWDTVKAKAQELLDKVQPVIDAIKTKSEGLATSVQNLWNTYVSPVIDSAKEAIEKLWGIIQQFWEVIVKPIIDEIISTVTNLWNDSLKPLWDHIAALIESVVGLVQVLSKWVLAIVSAIMQGILQLWNQVLAPLISWILGTFGPVFKDIFAAVGDAVQVAVDLICGVLDIALDALKGVLDFITAVFQGDWEGAWNAIKETFTNIWDDISEKADKVLGGIQEFLSNIVQGIKDLIGGLGDLGGSVLEKAKTAWGNLQKGPVQHSMSTSAPIATQLSSMPVPALATGAVIPPNRRFLAMLGDQTNGTNIEAPLATIQQALAEVLAEQGGPDITIKFAASGGLEQLVRVLKPYIDKENNRRGVKLIAGGVY